MTLLPDGSVKAWPKPSEPRMSTSRKKRSVGTKPPMALTIDQATMVTAIDLVRFQRSARNPAGMVEMPLTRMKAEKRMAMGTLPTWKAFSICLLEPRTMNWSMLSMNNVNPTTHMGQFETLAGRAAAGASARSSSAVLMRRPPRQPVPLLVRAQAPGV
jgi:hypothetical protein